MFTDIVNLNLSNTDPNGLRLSSLVMQSFLQLDGYTRDYKGNNMTYSAPKDIIHGGVFLTHRLKSTVTTKTTTKTKGTYNAKMSNKTNGNVQVNFCFVLSVCFVILLSPICHCKT